MTSTYFLLLEELEDIITSVWGMVSPYIKMAYIAPVIGYVAGIFSTIFAGFIKRKNAIQIKLSEESIEQEFIVIKNISSFPIHVTSISQCGFFSRLTPALEEFDEIHFTEKFTNFFTWKSPKNVLIENKFINPDSEKECVFRASKKVKIKISWENTENGKKYSRKYVLTGSRYRKPH